jgi:homoserine O-acetyltransferase
MKIVARTALINQSLPLESGQVLDRFELAYETYGELNAQKDNAILICHGYTANQHAAGCGPSGEAKPGWWDAAIGPGKPIDTNRYFVLSSNVLGGAGGSSCAASLDPTTKKPYGMRFPVVTIGDIVKAQHQLSEQMSISRFHAIVGGCMGGFQVMEWMASFPSHFDKAVVLAATYRVSAHTIALMAIIRDAICSDPDWQGGDYYGSGRKPDRGMGLATRFGLCIWMGRSVMEQRFANRLSGDKRLHYGFGPEFEIEQFLQQVGAGSGEKIDPNSLIYLGRTMQYFDLSRRYPYLPDAFEHFQGKALLVSYDSDWRYPPEEMELIHQALESAKVPSKHITLSSTFGHGAFIYDFSSLAPVLSEFLN